MSKQKASRNAKPLAPTYTNACLSQTQMPAILITLITRTSQVYGLRSIGLL